MRIALRGDGVGERHPLADQAGGQLARAGGDHELLAAMQLDQQRARGDQRAAALGDELEDDLEVGLAAERARDLGGRLERRDGARELLVVARAAPV